MNKNISIILILLLLLCLFKMPYGYYQLVRASMFVGLGALLYSERHNALPYTYQILFVLGIVLFNPLVKIYLGREIWVVVDLLYALILILYLYHRQNNLAEENHSQ